MNGSFFPSQCEPTLFLGAVEQIQINKVLIWNTGIRRKRFEVSDNIGLQANRDGLLQAFYIRVPLRFRKIIFFSHFIFSKYGFCSFVPAFRAEMILIEVPPSGNNGQRQAFEASHFDP